MLTVSIERKHRAPGKVAPLQGISIPPEVREQFRPGTTKPAWIQAPPVRAGKAPRRERDLRLAPGTVPIRE
jgi:hypothetical protein